MTADCFSEAHQTPYLRGPQHYRVLRHSRPLNSECEGWSLYSVDVFRYRPEPVEAPCFLGSSEKWRHAGHMAPRTGPGWQMPVTRRTATTNRYAPARQP